MQINAKVYKRLFSGPNYHSYNGPSDICVFSNRPHHRQTNHRVPICSDVYIGGNDILHTICSL